MSISELRSALEQFYSSDTAHEHKQQIEQYLKLYRGQPSSQSIAVEILKQSQQISGQDVSDLYLLYFACTVLEEVVLTRWDDFPSVQADKEYTETRDFLFGLVVHLYSRLPGWASTKLAKTMVLVSMHTRVLWQPTRQLLAAHESRQCGLFLLSLTIEECVRGDLSLPAQRKEQLLTDVTAQLPHTLQQLTAIVTECTDALQHSQQVAAACETLSAAQKCLLAVLVWAPLSEHISPALLGALLQVVQAAAASPSDSSPVSQCGADAVMCLTEVLGKKLVPKHLQPLILELAQHMLIVLRSLTRDNGALLADANSVFITNLIGFLSVLLEQHLPRIVAQSSSNSNGSSSSTKFPVGELLSLLAAFTFQQPDTESLQQCLQPWTAFAAMVTDSEAGEHVQAMAAEHAEGLSGVCEQLLYKVLYSSNSEGLEELDSEYDGPSTNSSSTNMLDDTDEDHSSSAKYTDSEEGDAQCSELDSFIAEVLALLRLCAQLPAVGAKLSSTALSLFNEVLSRLGPAAAAAADGAAFTAARLASDAATLCTLVGAGGAVDAVLTAAGYALDACNVMVQAQLHARGAAYAKLQIALLQALARLAPTLAAAAAAEQHRALATADGAAAAAATVLRSCSSSSSNGSSSPTSSSSNSSGVAPPSEAVLQSAADLLLCLARALRPQHAACISTYSSLLQQVEHVSAPLPPLPRTTLYLALAAYLLPPGGASTFGGGNTAEATAKKQQQAERAQAYRQLLVPLTAALERQAAAAGSSGSIDFNAVSLSCRVLTALCRAFAGLATRRSQKADFQTAITPALHPALALLAPCLQASTQQTDSSSSSSDNSAAAAAVAVLRLLVAAVISVGREFGAALADQILGELVSLFDTGKVSTEFGAGHGKAGLLLVAGMYKLLAGVLSTRSQRVQELLPRATTLSLQMLSACTAAARQHRQQSSSSSSSGGGSSEHDVLDAVMPDFLAVVGSICDSQWHCFIESAAKAGLSTEPVQPKPVSPAAAALFTQLWDAVCGYCVQAAAEAPAVVPRRVTAGAIELLRKQNSAHGLFALPAFAAAPPERLAQLLDSVLMVLASGEQPLLVEELSMLVRDVAMVDEAAFFQQFLPQFLSRHFCKLSETKQSAILSTSQTSTSFEQALAAFLNDLRYYVKQAHAE